MDISINVNYANVSWLQEMCGRVIGQSLEDTVYGGPGGRGLKVSHKREVCVMVRDGGG